VIRILVTAFGAFPGAPSNPTMAIAAQLQKRARAFRRTGIEIRTLVLPVIFAGTSERLAHAIRDNAPDAVLHLGLAGRRKIISVEARALNRLTIIHNDVKRKLSGTIQVEKHGEPVRRSRFAAARLAASMSSGAALARVSVDAGHYLCNQVLYLSLGMHKLPCGFIHVPRPRGNRRARPECFRNSSRPELAAITQAIEAAIRQVAVDTRRQRVST